MADPAVPVVARTRWQRWMWARRWRRAMRRGEAERDAMTLQRIRTGLTGRELSVGVVDATVSELVFDDDARIRLGWAHRPTLRRLGEAAASGGIRLVRVDHTGRLWALYVATRAGVVPLLTPELRLLGGQGGTGPALERPGADRPPALV